MAQKGEKVIRHRLSFVGTEKSSIFGDTRVLYGTEVRGGRLVKVRWRGYFRRAQRARRSPFNIREF